MVGRVLLRPSPPTIQHIYTYQIKKSVQPTGYDAKFDSIEKSLEQVVVNMEKIQVKQEILKDRQAKLEVLIKKRNDIDRPKKLTRAVCATIIVNIMIEKKQK